MTGIVITGHGQYAQGVMSAIQLVAGVPEQVQVVNFTKGEGIEELKSHMIQAINALESDDVLLMTDILGGSPFNVAVQLLTEPMGKNLKVVAGANMASIVQALFIRENVPFEQLPAEVIQAGKEGIMDVSAMMEGTM
ncbi:PTS sugar transporter subunit IIA [Enterocloster sp. OA13]|uniref:PTS sugar transporter subunit IIA n=1 Tax=Enterocloster TaxID=2719313 RepID=UPI00046ED489|nr:PTS sugar transporter subunit IIA [Lachnoclostridium pacaense]MCC2817086.1 PTS sugar transporter subunit IIA [Lachnoclostridium pacaense]MCH1951371.1 PTS sugar transporter subunit IIA [Enterocloster sp. OA13]